MHKIRSSPRDSAMPKKVSTKDTVCFQTGDRSILGKGTNACSGRPDARTLMFVPSRRQMIHLVGESEVKELNRARRMTQRLAKSAPGARTNLLVYAVTWFGSSF